MKKISFLIAAHNEEEVIGPCIENLLSIPYNNYEILIGLDGCTDNTKKIIEKFPKSNKLKYYELNIREGKAKVINFLVKKAKGDIIVIHDADWLFKFNNKKYFEKMFNIFKDSSIGGIAESFPVEFDKNKIKNGNLGYKMVAYSSYYWLNFQKEKFTKKIHENIYQITEPSMFLVNILRKNLYNENTTLGDDFERTHNIVKRGYKVILFNDFNMPRMIAIYDKIYLKNLFKQKIRTAIARKQLSKKQDINLNNYYLKATNNLITNSFKDGFKIGFYVFFWIILSTISTFLSKFKKQNTTEGWTLRAR